MGWFWADNAAPPIIPPHQIPSSSDAKPPPSCPMHQKPIKQSPLPPLNASDCPYVPPDATPSKNPSPLSSSSSSLPSSPSTAKPQVTPAQQSALSKLNPLNYMPANLSNKRAENQSIVLGVDRETSTIPRGDGSGYWEYPSPQQMYNAMLRKGYADTPEDAVTSMVAVHNFLNEGAWEEIVEWERRFAKGLGHGVSACAKGEEGAEYAAAIGQDSNGNIPPPKLLRFMGRPGDLTPKAQFMQGLGWLMPSKFNSEPPFDRHDWFVERTQPDGSVKEVRYVIDYYSGPPEPTGEPVFFLDVRPAIDGPTAACERLLRWGGDVWWRGTGGSVREQLARQKELANSRS